jgi:hypothetical protein
MLLSELVFEMSFSRRERCGTLIFDFAIFLINDGQVEVVALSSYEEKEEQFKEQVEKICFLLFVLRAN